MFNSTDITARFIATQCHGLPGAEEEFVPVAKICYEEVVMIPITVKRSHLKERATSFSGGNCVIGQTALHTSTH